MRHKRVILTFFLVLVACCLSTLDSYAQQERKFIRQGNKSYEKEDYVTAEVDYLRALDKDSTSYLAKFNLGDALYKQKKYDQAEARFSLLTADSVNNTEHRSASYYNLGNTMFEQQKYQEAIDAYKSSLRINPSDTTAKFNLAYAQLKLQNQQDQQNQDKNKDQNQDKDKDKDKDDQNKDKNDKNDQNKDKDKDKDDKDKDKDDKGDKDKNKDGKNDKDDKGDGKNQPQQGQMSKEEADKMLQAIQGNEDKTQQKVKDKKGGVVVGGSRKNW